MARLTHFDEKGRARMVDVSTKRETQREAIAAGAVYAKAETLDLIADRKIGKGDVLAVARLAGIMAAKRTAEFIPLCHPLPLTSVEVDLRLENDHIAIEARVQTVGRTGVEMEALTAVSIAALTVYDMCKAVDRSMVMGNIRLLKKSGGKSGTFLREEC